MANHIKISQEYNILEMLSSSYKENIDLDYVVYYFNTDQERIRERVRDLKEEIVSENVKKAEKKKRTDYER